MFDVCKGRSSQEECLFRYDFKNRMSLFLNRTLCGKDIGNLRIALREVFSSADEN